MQVPIVAGGAGPDPFEATDGGTIHLDEAEVRFSDLRLEEPPSGETTASRILRTVSPIQAAWAHPGHDYPGDVAGELLGDFTVDLLAPDADLGLASCYDGPFATGRVTLAGSVVVLGGTHVAADGTERPFHFEVTADQQVVGIPFDVELSAEAPPAAIAVRFDPQSALQFAEWKTGDADGDGLLTAADGTYGNTVTFGSVATPTWSLGEVP